MSLHYLPTGTGTLAGDLIKAEAIHRSIGRCLGVDSVDNAKRKLLVGSVKTIRSYSGTPGVAGFTKVCLAIQN